MTTLSDLLAAQESHRDELAERFAESPPETASNDTGPPEAVGASDGLLSLTELTTTDYEILFDRAASGSEVATKILEANGIEPPEIASAKTGDAGRRGRPESAAWQTDRGFTREVRTHLRAATARKRSGSSVDVIGTRPDLANE